MPCDLPCLAIFQGFDGILDQLLADGADKIPMLCHYCGQALINNDTAYRGVLQASLHISDQGLDNVRQIYCFLRSSDIRKHLADLIGSIGEMLRKSLDFFQIFI